MIYTMAGSLGLLLSIQVMGLATGTFDILELMDKWVALDGRYVARIPGYPWLWSKGWRSGPS